MKRYIVNCKNVTTREEFYDLLEKKLPLPDYFGRNLDALHDVLGGAGFTLEVRSFGLLRQRLERFSGALERMLTETDEESLNFRAVIKE